VEALSAQLDVKQQAKQKVADTKELIADKAQTVRAKGSEVGSHVVDVATDDEGSIRPVVPVAALVLVAAVVGVVVWRRRR
jgi:MYXO-CTERM domain-containing protein